MPPVLVGVLPPVVVVPPDLVRYLMPEDGHAFVAKLGASARVSLGAGGRGARHTDGRERAR